MALVSGFELKLRSEDIRQHMEQTFARTQVRLSSAYPVSVLLLDHHTEAYQALREIGMENCFGALNALSSIEQRSIRYHVKQG